METLGEYNPRGQAPGVPLKGIQGPGPWDPFKDAKHLSRKEAESQHRVHEYIIFHMSFDEWNRLGRMFQQSKSLVSPLEDQKAWTKF